MNHRVENVLFPTPGSVEIFWYLHTFSCLLKTNCLHVTVSYISMGPLYSFAAYRLHMRHLPYAKNMLLSIIAKLWFWLLGCEIAYSMTKCNQWLSYFDMNKGNTQNHSLPQHYMKLYRGYYSPKGYILLFLLVKGYNIYKITGFSCRIPGKTV